MASTTEPSSRRNRHQQSTSTVSQRSGVRRVTPGRVLLAGLLAVATVYFLLPVYWLAISATKSSSDLFGTFGLWLSDEPQLWENLRLMLDFGGGVFGQWALNSLLYAGVGAAVATLIAAAAGYAIGKYRFRGREAVFNIVLAGVLLPGTALALPMYLMFSQLGLANTYWGVLLPSMVSPFGVYLCRIYAESAISDTLLEAARIDGTGEIRIFGSIALRVMSPALVTVFLFQFVSIWNNFFLPLVMLSEERLYPITLGLYNWNYQTERVPEAYQAVLSGALVSVIPLAVAMVVLQRFWRSGLTQGSVKE